MRNRFLTILAAVALLASACGSAGDDEAASAGDEAVAESTPVPESESEESVVVADVDGEDVDDQDEEAAAPIPGVGGPASGIPDATANVRPRAADFTEIVEVDLDWQELDAGFEAGNVYPIVERGAAVLSTIDHDFVLTTDGQNFETILEWDVPANIAFGPDAWYLLTPDPDSAIEMSFRTEYQRWTVLRSADEGVSWTDMALDATAPAGDGYSVALSANGIQTVGGNVSVFLTEIYEIDWQAQAQATGLATADEKVYALDAGGGPTLALQIVGPDRNETINPSADELGIDRAILDSALGLTSPDGTVFTSVDDGPFENADVDTLDMFALERFDDGVRLDGFGQPVRSLDGVIWEPFDTGAVEVNWAIDGWWMANRFGPAGVSLEQSLDGGETFSTIEAPVSGTFPQFTSLFATGGGAMMTEDTIGEARGEPLMAVNDDGFTFIFDQSGGLTVTDPEGVTAVDEAFLFGGRLPDDLLLTLEGQILLFSDTNEIRTQLSLDDLFGESPFGPTGGRTWAMWTQDGGTWFADEVDFSPGTTLLPLGDVVLAIPTPPFNDGQPILVATVNG